MSPAPANCGIVTFGGLALTRDDGPYDGAPIQRRQLALLVLLAGAGPAGMSKDKLTEYLWPERDGERARNLLDQALSSARRAFGGGSIVTMATAIALNQAFLTVDRTLFDQAVREEAWGRAVSLYAGPFLDGVVIQHAPAFMRWAESERARCARQFADGVEALAVDADRAGRAGEAMRWWKRLVETDPLSARATTGLMLALTATGERAAALELARAYDGRVSRALGAAPDPAVGVLADALRRGSLPRTVPVAAPVAPPVRVTGRPSSRWVIIILVTLLVVAAAVVAVVFLGTPTETT